MPIIPGRGNEEYKILKFGRRDCSPIPRTTFLILSTSTTQIYPLLSLLSQPPLNPVGLEQCYRVNYVPTKITSSNPQYVRM